MNRKNAQLRHLNFAQIRHSHIAATDNVEASFRCRGWDFLEMSGFKVQKYLC
jgi:hypothetical protein